MEKAGQKTGEFGEKLADYCEKKHIGLKVYYDHGEKMKTQGSKYPRDILVKMLNKKVG